jgi:hypothetical protein
MNPANWKGAPTVFGSQRTSFAAKAVALDSVRGAVASTPVIAAMVSVWRTFFNIVPFAGARAEVSPAMWAGTCVQAGGCFESRRLVRARQRGRARPTGLSPDGHTEASSPSAASAHTRIRVFDFALTFTGRKGPYETGLQSASRDTPISRSNNDSITVIPANCLCRSQAHFPGPP